MSNSVASGYSSRRKNPQRKYNIAPELLASPYLSSPIGAFHHGEKKKRSGSPRRDSRKKSPHRKREDSQTYYPSSDAEESAATRGSSRSGYSAREIYTAYRRSSGSNVQRNMSMKNIMMPREADKILRVFRQKYSDHPILKNHAGENNHRNSSKDRAEEDDSTIDSDFAESIDDEAVYSDCVMDENLKSALFSGPLFAEIALRNAGRRSIDEEVPLTLPPVVHGGENVVVERSEDISDLESLHSVSEGRHSQVKPKGVLRKTKR